MKILKAFAVVDCETGLIPREPETKRPWITFDKKTAENWAKERIMPAVVWEIEITFKKTK